MPALEYDLTFVDPDLREEVLRRIKVIEEFQRNPGRNNAARAASLLGINTPHFYRLARIWRDSGRAEYISSGKRNSIRKSRLDQIVQRIMREAEAKHPAANAAVIERAMASAIEAAGLKMPARSTIAHFIGRVRRERNAGMPAGIGMALDFCTVSLPVIYAGTTILPTAALVIDLERSSVVGCALGRAMTDDLAAKALLDAMDTEPAVDPMLGNVDIRMPAGVLSDDFRAPLAGSGLHPIIDSRHPGYTARRTLGPKLAGFKTITRVTDLAASLRAARRKSASLVEARDVMRSRIRAGMRHVSPLSQLSGLDRAQLREHLLRTLAAADNLTD